MAAQKKQGGFWKMLSDYNFIILTISGLIISYQSTRILELNRIIGQLDAQVEKYESIIDRYQILDYSQKNITVDDQVEHEPHSHYFDNIEKDPHNPKKPLYPDAQYTYDDFVSIFQVEPIHHSIVSEEVKELLDGHDLFTDDYYLSNSVHIDSMIEKTKSFFEIKDQEAYLRELCYIKWASIETGFGLYAKQDIPANQVIGVYTGIVAVDSDNTDYEWEYQTDEIDGEEVNIGVNALKYGNYLRFANHVGEASNSKPEFVPHNGLWHVLYVAAKDIKKGEEITTDYGDAYFASRPLQ
ncbi:hypothetical protein HDV04_002822 [Boothiomyces sp. JEL0838]|nr:hypothetical protein HDV04_002822 [Boothiomyces sp. JEL0838]